MELDPFLLKIMSFIRPLPSVADRVLYLARQDPVDFKELTRVIETDPTLSTMVISLANSPLYAVSNRTVDSLNRAILMLGQGRIVDSVMAYMTRSIRQEATVPWPKGDLNFWKHCISVATCARMLAEKMQIPAAQKCFIAGLIHDVGKLALLNYDAPKYRQVLEDVERTQRPIEFAELEAFGVTHANLSGYISRHWKLPQHFMNAIAYHHDNPDNIAGTLANVVRSANLFAKIAGFGESGNPYNMLSNDLLMPHPRISQNDIQDILARLPKLVGELTVLILGAKSGAEKPSAQTNKVRPAVSISVRISDGVERVLMRYLASALGYDTSFGRLEIEEGVKKVVIMDFTSAIVDEDTTIIDFSEWRKEQKSMPENRLNVISLRNWFSSKMEEITGTPAAGMVSA